MYDIIFLSVPYGTIVVPPLGISVLNGVVKYHGYKAKSFDLSMELSKKCSSLNIDFESVQSTLLNPGNQLEPVFVEFIDEVVDRLIKLNPKFVGISAFSYFAHFCTFYLCTELRKRSNLKIVIGGPGVDTIITEELHGPLSVTSLEKMLKFGEFLKKRNLTDYAIVGDGEQAILDLLAGDSTDLNNFQIFDYKQEFPFSNFDDYNFWDYKGQLDRGHPQIPVFTSKGCVRNCDFCDVNVIQQKFRFRQGKNIVKELIYLADKYGIREFNFSDSLVNGSIKSLVEWTEELAEYNKNNPDKKITWTGMWMNRPIGQIKEHVYKLLGDSGCKALSIGTETGSNNVLLAMNKKTTVEALFYEVKQLQQYDVPFITLLIVGHWAEQWDDFLQTLIMIYKLADYVKTGHYIAAGIGNTLNIIKDSPMDKGRETQNKLQSISPNIWWTELNPGLTLKERYYRLLIIEKFCRHFHIPLMERVLPYVHKALVNDLERSNEFYQEKISTCEETPAQFAEHYYNDFETLVKNIIERESTDEFVLELLLDTSAVNGNPGIEISFNGEILFNDLLKEGSDIPVRVFGTQQNTNSLKIKMINKGIYDTVVDEQGNIVKDKFILIKKLKINGLDLVDDIEFYFANTTYKENSKVVESKLGFWAHDSELEIKFDGLFKPWYHHNSKKYGTFAANIISEKTFHTTKDDEWYRQQIVEILKSIKT